MAARTTTHAQLICIKDNEESQKTSKDEPGDLALQKAILKQLQQTGNFSEYSLVAVIDYN